jgi:hypothetical protein
MLSLLSSWASPRRNAGVFFQGSRLRLINSWNGLPVTISAILINVQVAPINPNIGVNIFNHDPIAAITLTTSAACLTVSIFELAIT